MPKVPLARSALPPVASFSQLEKFKQRYELEMIEKFDTHFYVGTVHKNPAPWIIVGLFYPPKAAEHPLFPC